MTIKTALLTFVLALTLLGSHTVQVVHDAVHPFHAHLVGEAKDPHSTKATDHQHTHSIEPWLCDLFDAFSHSKAAVSQVFHFEFTPDLQPGLVAIYPILALNKRYRPFQSRAPPIAFSV
jgi:ABC-type nickel/cobalt efflux system permease component RcnA